MLIKMTSVVLYRASKLQHLDYLLSLSNFCFSSLLPACLPARIKLTFVSHLTKISQVLTDNKIIQNSIDLLLHKCISWEGLKNQNIRIPKYSECNSHRIPILYIRLYRNGSSFVICSSE